MVTLWNYWEVHTVNVDRNVWGMSGSGNNDLAFTGVESVAPFECI